jgi:hypothetical protein
VTLAAVPSVLAAIPSIGAALAPVFAPVAPDGALPSVLVAVPPVLVPIPASPAIMIVGHRRRRLEADERRQQRSCGCRSDVIHLDPLSRSRLT